MLVDQNKKGYCFLLSICKIQLQVLWHAGIKCIHIHLYKKIQGELFWCIIFAFLVFLLSYKNFAILCLSLLHVAHMWYAVKINCSWNIQFFIIFQLVKLYFFLFSLFPCFFILAFLNACTRFVHKCVNIVLKWQQNFNVKNISEKSYNKIQFNMHISTQFSMNIKNNRNSYKQKEFKKHTYTFYGNKK